MQTPENNPSFRQALDLLSRGVDAQALSLLTGLGQETGEAGASRLARLFCLALLGEWSELERASASWPFGPLQTVSALRALSLAKMEPSEEALRLALDSAWLPSRPIPEPGDEALWRLWTLWEGPLSARLLRVQLGRQGESLAREAPRPSGGGRDHEAAEAEASDPFLEAILALLDPLPGRARSLLGGAVEIGLDLAPARLALARLHRRAHDRDGARAILRRIPGETLEAPWQERLAKEIEACARDSELQRATKVRLERGPDSRVLRRARGVLLSIETKGQTWTRPVESEPLGAALAGMVSDHLAAAWVLADWTLAEGDTDMHEGLDEALERRDYPRALSLGRRLMSSRPDDAALAARVLAAAVNLREPQGAIELSQRAVVLTEEAPSALRRHAALLFAAGTVEESLGVLFYLEERYGPWALDPASIALLAGCHILPRFNPGIARDFLSVGLESHPGDPALLETKARLQLLEDSPMEALATLEPLLEATRPPASVLALALQALLDQDAGGAEAFARKALSLHPQDRLLAALAQEVAGRTGPAMEAHLRAVEESRGPMATLEGQLWAMRAAIRLSAFEDALRLARLAQTRIGDPDPRCLDAIYESLSALEPGEPREDLAEMAQEARRRATRRKLSPEDRARAQLAAGFHLDPVLLGPLWDGLQARGPLDPLPAANPEPTRALLPIATGTGCAALFDVQGLAASMAKAPWDWLRDPELVAKAQESGHLVLAALPSERPSWLRVCSTPPRPAHRFSKGPELALKVSSGQVFAGPGEALLGSPGDAASPLGLAEELGGRLRLLPVGRYQVTIWRAEGGPWPGDEVGEDPADLVFQLGPPIK